MVHVLLGHLITAIKTIMSCALKKKIPRKDAVERVHLIRKTNSNE